MCIFGAKSPRIDTVNVKQIGEIMKNLLSALVLVAMSSASYAGGQAMMNNGQGNSMSSAKASSGVHFYGRMYIGYDDKQTNDVERLDDGGSKSRLGLKLNQEIL